MIFVSVGIERFPFDRLVRAVDQAAGQLEGEPIFIQLGCGTYLPTRCAWTRFLPYQELVTQIEQARVVVSHAGAGSLLLCARCGKVPVVLPRRKRFHEHVDDHQLEWAAHMARLGYLLLAEHPEEIVALIVDYGERRAALPGCSPAQASLADFLAASLAADGAQTV